MTVIKTEWSIGKIISIFCSARTKEIRDKQCKNDIIILPVIKIYHIT